MEGGKNGLRRTSRDEGSCPVLRKEKEAYAMGLGWDISATEEDE